MKHRPLEFRLVQVHRNTLFFIETRYARLWDRVVFGNFDSFAGPYTSRPVAERLLEQMRGEEHANRLRNATETFGEWS